MPVTLRELFTTDEADYLMFVCAVTDLVIETRKQAAREAQNG